MIHRYWRGTPPPPLEPWVREVIANLHPAHRVHDWDDDTLPGEIHDRFIGDPLAVDPRHRANIIRWSLLHMFGGAWLDHDVVPLRPLPEGAWTASLPHSRTACAVRVPKGHRLPARMLDAIAAAPRPARARPVDVSGDNLLNRVTLGWDDLERHTLPFDAVGKPIPGATPWALHLWATTAPVRFGQRG